MTSGGQILWNAVAICEMSKTSWQTGKTPYERRFGEPLKGPIIPFGAMVEYHPFSPRDFSRIHQFGNKVLPGIFLGYEPIAGDLERRFPDCRFRRIGKVGCIRNLSQKTECKRSPDNLQRRRICISCGRWFNNIITKRLRIPRTHSETGTHRKERESQRRISRR